MRHAATLTPERTARPRPSLRRPHRSARADLDPFLVEECTLTREEVLRARAADHFWDSAARDAA